VYSTPSASVGCNSKTKNENNVKENEFGGKFDRLLGKYIKLM